MIPIEVMTEDSAPAADVRYLCRQVAKEDGTTFNQALKGYQAMVTLVKSVAARESLPVGIYGDAEVAARQKLEQGHAFRILEARLTFRYPLLRAVRAMTDKDVAAKYNKPVMEEKKRQCKSKGCKSKTAPGAYRFCKKHIPVNPQTDDGDGVYCCPPPKSVGSAIKAGAEKIKGRALRTMAGDFVYVPDAEPRLDEQAGPAVLEE